MRKSIVGDSIPDYMKFIASDHRQQYFWKLRVSLGGTICYKIFVTKALMKDFIKRYRKLEIISIERIYRSDTVRLENV